MPPRLVRAIRHPIASGQAVLERVVYPARLGRTRGVTLIGSVRLLGWPELEIHRDAELVIGDGVVLNSRNRGYHLNMHSPVKLLLDRPGARIRIGANTRIHGTCIHAVSDIFVGTNCLIAANTQIIDSSGHDLSFPDVAARMNTHGKAVPVRIEDNVWIGANSIILPGSRVGAGSVIGAGSVVRGEIPANAIAAGNPAVVVKRYEGAMPASLRAGGLAGAR